MKSLDQFKSHLTEEEKEDFSKFDMLVRAGLANKAQIMRLHRILEKMGEERPQFNTADRAIMQNLFNKMIDLLSNNKQIFQQTRRAVREEVELSEGEHTTSDYKLNSDGRKVRAHRFEVGEKGKDDTKSDPIDTTDELSDYLGTQDKKLKPIKEEDDAKMNSGNIKNDPPFTLILKRKAIRMYPNNTRVALYWCERLKRYISVPYQAGGGDIGIAQVEEFIPEEFKEVDLSEGIIQELETIKKTKQNGKVGHLDGKSSPVDLQTAHLILSVHGKLNDENKKKIAELARKSKESFSKVVAFAQHNTTKK